MTDAYTQCQDGVKALMLTLTAYFPNNWQVSTNEFNLTKVGDYFMLLAPGKTPIVPVAAGLPISRNNPIKTYDWNILAGLYARFVDYETAMSNFTAVRGAIFDAVGSDPAFVFNSKIKVPGAIGLTVEGVNDVVFLQRTKTQAFPNYVYQSLRFVVRQTVVYKPKLV